ncbi:MAG: pyridoxamine 5'-phosphate oxidase family protein [Luteibacter sp.]
MNTRTRFHDGELSVQRRAGEAAIAERNGAIVAREVVGAAGAFIDRQFMVALGSVDAAGQVWASLVFGRPGFAHTADGTSIRIDVAGGDRDAVDPLWTNVSASSDLGMLFIDLGMRRRYRVNGKVAANDDEGIEVQVREAYPNCPKYIQRRQLRALGRPAQRGQAARGAVVRGAVEHIVRQADTLFVASHHPASGADVSHRGGAAGFVHIVDETTLRIPDFPGNSMFNTFGNFQVDPRAGLCIPDFIGGRLLQLTGTASVQWDSEDPTDETGGTHRYLEFRVGSWILRDATQRAEWDYLDASPFIP